MKSIHDIRRDNLRRLIDSRFERSQTLLAKVVGLQPSFVSRLLSDREATQKNIGSRLARRIETAVPLPPNWLDSLENVPVGHRYVIKSSRDSAATTRAGENSFGFGEVGASAGLADADAWEVPLLTASQLGQFEDIAAVYRTRPSAKVVPVSVPIAPKHAVAMELGDDSMGEQFPKGTIVVTADDRIPRYNNFVVVIPSGSNTPTMRLWIPAGPRELIVPIDDAYEAEELKPTHRLYGVVVEVITPLTSPVPRSPDSKGGP